MTHPHVSVSTSKTHTTVSLPTTLGLDLPDRISHFHVRLGDGRPLSSGKVTSVRDDLSELFQQWKAVVS